MRRRLLLQALGLVYKLHYPTYSWRTARGAKRLPLHDRHAALRARFRDVSGWEGVDWYAPPGAPAGTVALPRTHVETRFQPVHDHHAVPMLLEFWE